MEKLINWCIEQHNITNHMYDSYLPYRFHLEMVVREAKRFQRLVPSDRQLPGEQELLSGKIILPERLAIIGIQPKYMREALVLASYGHDLIEDTRVTYNDVQKMLGTPTADIVYALTNEKGRNRKERANAAYYEGIMMTPGARFVKLCDRIANVTYSEMMGSRMFEMYKKENKSFEKSLERGNYQEENLEPMFVHLENILQRENVLLNF